MTTARITVTAKNTTEAVKKANEHFEAFFENEVAWSITGAAAIALTTYGGEVLTWEVAVEAETGSRHRDR